MFLLPWIDPWQAYALTIHPSRRRFAARLNSSYKGFPTFVSNTSPWMDRCTISPGTGLLIGQQSAPNLVLAARRCLLANGADGVTTNGH